MAIDKSNGYEGIAKLFIKGRGRAVHGIGVSSVRSWVQTFPKNSTFLDLGCGTGIPVSMILDQAGMHVCGIDASPSMVEAYQQNFPKNEVRCEAAEESSFFNRTFDGIISWGLLFLLTKDAQEIVIQNAAKALQPGGRLVFTSPPCPIQWKDAMTDRDSVSLGAERYKELLTASGLMLVSEFEDEGENHYYNAIKI